MKIKDDQNPEAFLRQAGIDELQRRAGYIPKVTKEKLPLTFEQFRKAKGIRQGKGSHWANEYWINFITKDHTRFLGPIFRAAQVAYRWWQIPRLKDKATKYAWYEDHLSLSGPENAEIFAEVEAAIGDK